MNSNTESGNTIREFISLGKLAIPLILTSLVSMGLAITDVIMMNWLGPAELAAGAATSDYYSIVFYLVGGIIAAMSPILSQARGSGNATDVREYTHHGFILAIIISIPTSAIVWHSPSILSLIGVDQSVVDLAYGYAHMMSLTYIFMVCSVACHDFLAAHERTNIILYISMIGLPLNAAANYVFMFGHYGFPAMGLAGAGLASALVSATMLVAYIIYILNHDDYKHYHLIASRWNLSWERFKSLMRVGLPIGISTFGELGVYLLSTVVIGVFGVEALAAHALALRLAGVLYAAPLGLSQAATVRSGMAVGANDAKAYKRTARAALIIAISIGVFYMVTLELMRDSLATNFFNEENLNIATLAIVLLGLLAMTQPFECIATVSNGLLRGMKDTKVPMIISVSVFWLFGIGGGWTIAFIYEYEAQGIWIGLLAATIAFCLSMFSRFIFMARTHELLKSG